MSKSETPQQDPEFANLHTFQLQLFSEEEKDQEHAWYDIQVNSSHDDARTALLNYLRTEFPEKKNIPESKEGIFTVEDGMLGTVVMHRRYRVKPR